MRVLGVDQSLHSTGWFLLEDGVPIKCGIISGDTYKDDDSGRLNYMYHQFLHLFDDADVIAVGYEEQVPQMRFAKNAKYILKLAELLGVLKAAIVECKKEPIGVKISDVKKRATGNGNAKKELIISMMPTPPMEIINALGVKKIDDLCDAYWIATIADERCRR